ncbi:MAG: hypothetical protein GF417_10170 [Candidatus Latescibacteria bacterium]|nr:hypothetical protein [bacterium]MBD3424792.1 hypothetical protein [Candidatus Latescibacterota bacterium]
MRRSKRNQGLAGGLILAAILLAALPGSPSGAGRDCVVEITNAGIERNDGSGVLRLEWKLKEVLNWREIESGDLAQPLFRDIRKPEGCSFTVYFNGSPVGNSGDLKIRRSLGDFTINRGEIVSASVSLEESGEYRDISAPFSRRFNRDPMLGTAEITARPDTVYPGSRKAVRENLAGLRRTVSDGGVIASLLIIILIWGLFSVYVHLRRLYGSEFENLAAASEKVKDADGLEEAQRATEGCPVLSRMEIRAGVDEYRRRLHSNPGGADSARNCRELERLRSRMYSGVNRQLSRELEPGGRMLSWVISAEMIRCFGVLAPMVGLLGTVIGISDSFGGLYLKIKTIVTGQNRAVLENLSGGIHLALNTTVFGLIVGILFLLFYYLIQFRRSRIALRVDSAVENTLTQVVQEDYIIREGTVSPESGVEKKSEESLARAAAGGRI